MSRTGGALTCESISVSFGATKVLEDVALDLEPGEVHVLIGPNGAGKTTLANVISGHVSAQAGRVTLDGEQLTGPPHRRAKRGLGRKFQIPRVFPRLTARQQLILAAPSADVGHLEGELAELGETTGEELSHGWRQWLELQMVLLGKPSVIVLDEPTSGLPRSERAKLADAIDAVPHGTFLLVEHDLDFVARIADRVSFMHNGKVLRTGTFQELSEDPLVRGAYMGAGDGN
jgi:urea transport system ATP-binding protein